MASDSKLLTIAVTAFITAVFTSVIVGSIAFGVWYFQNQEISKLKKAGKITQVKNKNDVQINRDKQTKTSNKWPYYKNERFAYMVQYPPGWKKFEAQNGDGMTLRKGTQKILIYGTTNYQSYKNIDEHLKTDYSGKIKSKTEIKAVKTAGFHVKTDMEEFFIYMSNDNFVYTYTDLPAKKSTIEFLEKIGKSFQVLGE